MNAPDNLAPQEMNWADYWDSLANEYFILRASAESRPVTGEHSAGETAVPAEIRRDEAHEPA